MGEVAKFTKYSDSQIRQAATRFDRYRVIRTASIFFATSKKILSAVRPFGESLEVVAETDGLGKQ